MKQILFKSAIAMAALAVGTASAEVTTVLDENFDGYTAGTTINGVGRWAAGDSDLSEVVADPRTGATGNVLELKTEGGELTNSFTSANATAANTAIGNGEPVVFESEIKFVPSDNDNCGLAGGDDTKFAIFAYAPDGGPTNLVIFHAYQDGSVKYTNEVIDVNGALDDPDKFTKVTVSVFNSTDFGGLFFTVALNDGALLETQVIDDNNADALDPDPSWVAGEDYIPMTWFKTVNGNNTGDDEFSAICFKGTGAVDNILVKAGEEASSGTTAQDDEGNTFTVPDTAFAGANVQDVTAVATGTSITYAQAYALGTYTVENNEVVVTEPEATIEFDDEGKPTVTLEGTNPNAAYTVTCTLYGSTTLPVDTSDPLKICDTGAPGEELTDNTASADTEKFYKVVITIQDK